MIDVWSRSAGLKVPFPENIYLIYTNLSISEEPPLWKVFSTHISVYVIIYNNNNISWRPHESTNPHDTHPKIWGYDPQSPTLQDRRLCLVTGADPDL